MKLTEETGQHSSMLLHERLLRRCAGEGERVAFVGADGTWSYGLLRSKVHAMVGTLVELGIGWGDRVVLLLDSSPAAFALEMACSAVGAVFVPVSPEMSRERLVQILVSTEASLVVHARSLPNVGEVSQRRAILTAEGVIEGGPLSGGRSTNVRLVPSDLAYVIFTSGTTGVPKGIMMTHLAACAALEGIGSYGVSPSARVATASPLQFDFSLLDIGTALLAGAAVVHVPRTLLHHPPRLLRYLVSHGVTQLSGTPSLWRGLLQQPPEVLAELPLAVIVFGGEAMSVRELTRIRRIWPGIQLVQLYGQTESIACSYKVLPEQLDEYQGRLSCGRPMPGADVVVLGEDGLPVTRAGDIGEAYVRGPCLFSGYWRDPDATQAVLVPDPLAPHSGVRVLRSGDLVFLDEAGELHFSARRDTQVKLRGNRVELGDVDACIERMPGILHAVTVLDESASPACLVSFVVREVGGAHGGDGSAVPDSEIDAVRAWCARALPSYMVPGRCLAVDALPTTTQGKVDRRLLCRWAAASAGAKERNERP